MEIRKGSLFGVGVETELDLPLQEATPVEPVRILSGPVVRPTGEPEFRDEQVRIYHKSSNQVVITFTGAAVCMGRDELTIDPQNALNIDLLVFFAWPLLLSLRGRESLHGCVIEKNGEGVAVVGAQGSGKSTAALRLVELGFRLVADDLVVFDDEFRAIPGPPFIRLRTDQAAGYEGAWDAGGKLRYYPPVCMEPVRLGRIIVLDEAFGPPAPVSGAQAVDLLIRNLASGYLVQPRQKLNRFEFASAIARRVPMVGAKPRSLGRAELSRLAHPES